MRIGTKSELIVLATKYAPHRVDERTVVFVHRVLYDHPTYFISTLFVESC